MKKKKKTMYVRVTGKVDGTGWYQIGEVHEVSRKMTDAYCCEWAFKAVNRTGGIDIRNCEVLPPDYKPESKGLGDELEVGLTEAEKIEILWNERIETPRHK